MQIIFKSYFQKYFFKLLQFFFFQSQSKTLDIFCTKPVLLTVKNHVYTNIKSPLIKCLKLIHTRGIIRNQKKMDKKITFLDSTWIVQGAPWAGEMTWIFRQIQHTSSGFLLQNKGENRKPFWVSKYQLNDPWKYKERRRSNQTIKLIEEVNLRQFRTRNRFNSWESRQKPSICCNTPKLKSSHF